MANRIVTTENVTVRRELVAPITTIVWEPLSNTGVATFQVDEMVYIDDVFVQKMSKSAISLSISDVISTTYNLEVTPGTFVDVSGGLAMLIIKKAFEDAIAQQPA